MKFPVQMVALAVPLALSGWAVTPAQARTLNFRQSQGYQNQLAESRKAYTQAWEASHQPQPVNIRRAQKKKPFSPTPR